MSIKRVETRIGRHMLSIETGRIAKQADGAAVIRYADTVVLVTAVSAPNYRSEDFFPLRTDYREMTYAAGKFPGGFFKREGRPTPKETLTCRLMDRPIRPLFPDGYMDEVAVTGVVLSADKQHDPDILAMVGSSASLIVAGKIPFLGPTGAVRVGKVNGELVLNPSREERDQSTMELVIAGTDRAVMMLEGSAQEASNEEIIEAVMFAQRGIKEIVRIQRELAAAVGIKPPVVPPAEPDLLFQGVESKYYDRVFAANRVKGKFARRDALAAVEKDLLEERAAAVAEGEVSQTALKMAFQKLEKKAVRDSILQGVRGDGRSFTEVRDITAEVAVLPRVHGSALFTRGETQALVTCTLGTVSDEQRVDGLEEEYRKKFMLDYNFPPFCVGEARPVRGPSRREFGHGHLAEMSLKPVLPQHDEFPYTVRIVSDIMESNGSSSMASVCGGTMCMMDAGVPIRGPVAGMAMGMVVEGDQVVILSDIAGEEDHCGDMDLKIAGTRDGITGIQMDLKVTEGIQEETLARAFEQAREGRLFVIGEMLRAIEKPRAEISSYAPRLLRIRINPEKIGLVIGPGGKTIRRIQEETDSNIEIEDDGIVTISSFSAEGAMKAKQIVQGMTEEPEIGKVYLGHVTAVKDFGAFVEIMPGIDGLVHISEMSDSYVKDVASVCKVGDEMLVKLISIDDQNRIRLSRKQALKEQA